MNFRMLLAPLLALSLAGCAGAKPKDESQAGPENIPAKASAEAKKREAKERPLVKVGPDDFFDQDAALIWPLIAHVEDWGSWMPKVTKVEPGAGLNPGALIHWQWEEKSVESEIVTVKDQAEFAYKSTAASKKAVVRWTLKQQGKKRTLVSLRAEVPYGTASETMDKLSREMMEWITALKPAALKAKPAAQAEAE